MIDFPTFHRSQLVNSLLFQQAYSRRKDYFDHFSVAQVIIVRVFIIFNYIVLFSSGLWKFLFFTLRNNFLYANFPFHSLWSRERQLPAVTSKKLTLPVNNCYPELDLSEASKTSTLIDWLSLICLNEDPRMDQLFTELLKIAEKWIMFWLRSSLQLRFCF